MMWRVGNGANIAVWSDVWLKGQNGSYMLSSNITQQHDLKVADLIDYEAGAWNKEVIWSIFNEEEARVILAIPLSASLPSDIKSGYWLAKQGSQMPRTDPGSENKLWSKIWNLNGPPKLRHFSWQACKGSLPVMERLRHRHITMNAMCPICKEEEETIIHAIFECSNVGEIWQHRNLQETINEGPAGSFMERNKAVVGQPVQQKVMTAAGFKRLVEDYVSYAHKVFKQGGHSEIRMQTSWSVPPHGWVKVNTDAYVPNNGRVGLGVVIRDERGNVLVAGVRKIEPTEVEMAEAQAALYGVSLARRMGFNKVILEADALRVTMAVKSLAEGCSPIFLIYDDIHKICNSFDFFQCNHVKRSGNVVAHRIARWDTNGSDEFIKPQVYSFHGETRTLPVKDYSDPASDPNTARELVYRYLAYPEEVRNSDKKSKKLSDVIGDQKMVNADDNQELSFNTDISAFRTFEFDQQQQIQAQVSNELQPLDFGGAYDMNFVGPTCYNQGPGFADHMALQCLPMNAMMPDFSFPMFYQ
ncbi:hypothetical protein RDABS01_019525 [Bienertia sinuspersici]